VEGVAFLERQPASVVMKADLFVVVVAGEGVAF
jgi:hypothetical protein